MMPKCSLKKKWSVFFQPIRWTPKVTDCQSKRKQKSQPRTVRLTQHGPVRRESWRHLPDVKHLLILGSRHSFSSQLVYNYWENKESSFKEVLIWYISWQKRIYYTWALLLFRHTKTLCLLGKFSKSDLRDFQIGNSSVRNKCNRKETLAPVCKYKCVETLTAIHL